ncbi:hypothetical protein [Archaeoglobus sp.]
MGKVIQIEVPDWIDEEDIRKEIKKIIALKSIERIGTDVSDEIIDKLSKEIKRSMWKGVKRWLNLQ